MRALRILVGTIVVFAVSTFPIPSRAGTPTCFEDPATIVGTNGRDVIEGTSGPDVIAARGGRDRVLAKGGDDKVCGQGGKDWIFPGRGDDEVRGGPEADTLSYADSRRSVIVKVASHNSGRASGQGEDSFFGITRVIGSSSDDLLIGSPEPDSLAGGDGSDTIRGRGKGDVLTGGIPKRGRFLPLPCAREAGADTLYGGGGRDTLDGCGGRDTISGGPGADNLKGESGFVSSFYSSPRNPLLCERRDGSDILAGNAGRDLLAGCGGNDVFIGGRGGDTVRFAGAEKGVSASLASGKATGEGSDSFTGIEHLEGSFRADVLVGDRGDNHLSGGPYKESGGSGEGLGGWGQDIIRGRGGNDRINGGRHSDRLDGGFGRDTVIFETYSEGYGDGRVTVDLRSGTASGEGADRLSGIENVIAHGTRGNKLIGNRRSNRLEGGGFGNDVLVGGGGRDRLITGAAGRDGADRLAGGPAHDRCRGVDRGDRVSGCEVATRT